MELSRWEYKKLVDDVAASAVSRMMQMLDKLGMVEEDKWMTTKEAAAYLRRSECWVRRHRALLGVRKKGASKGSLYFRKSALAKYVTEE